MGLYAMVTDWRKRGAAWGRLRNSSAWMLLIRPKGKIPLKGGVSLTIRSQSWGGTKKEGGSVSERALIRGGGRKQNTKNKGGN